MASNKPNFTSGERIFFKEDKSRERPYTVQSVEDNGPGDAIRWVVLIKGSDGKQIEVEPSKIWKDKMPRLGQNSPKNNNTLQQENSPRGSEVRPPQPLNVPAQQHLSQQALPYTPPSETDSSVGSVPATIPVGKDIDSSQPTITDAYKAIRQVLKRITDLPEVITQGFGEALNHRDQELELRSDIDDLINKFSSEFAAKAGVPLPGPADGSNPSQQALDDLEWLEDAVLKYADKQDIQEKALTREIQSLRADAETFHAHKLQWASDNRALATQCERLKLERTEAEEQFRGLEQQTRSKRQTEQQEIGEGLTTFWEAREKFYRGLHRGILAEKEGDERKRLKNRREELLKSDIALLERLGCQMSLVQEALNFSRAPYDGSLHHWHEDRDDPVPNGQAATVFLPGWRIDNAEFKPSFGGQEIVE